MSVEHALVVVAVVSRNVCFTRHLVSDDVNEQLVVLLFYVFLLCFGAPCGLRGCKNGAHYVF